MQSNYRLVMRSGPSVGKVYPLDKAELFVGRDLNNDIVINDPEISRRHSRLFNQGNGIAIEDLGSTNGTFLNGQRLVGPQLLRPGDMVTFGERLSMVFESSEVDQDATMVSPASRGYQQPTTPPPADQEPPYAPPQPVQTYQAPQSYSPPPQNAYTPPPQYPQQQAYAGQVPGAYPPPPDMAPPVERRGPRTWLIVAIILLLLVCACGAFLWFAPTSFWCLFPVWPAGACP